VSNTSVLFPIFRKYECLRAHRSHIVRQMCSETNVLLQSTPDTEKIIFTLKTLNQTHQFVFCSQCLVTFNKHESFKVFVTDRLLHRSGRKTLPAIENSVSTGADEAGRARYWIASLDIVGRRIHPVCFNECNNMVLNLFCRKIARWVNTFVSPWLQASFNLYNSHQ
jgi:hypothetical protein